MKIEVNLLAGQQLSASFGDHVITSDQRISAGGLAAYPEPFDYFLASMPLCAAFYVRKFCEQRDISTNGIRVTQHNENIGDHHYQQKFALTISLPESFPKKYRQAIIAAANACTVKKVIQAMPEFEIAIG